MYIDYFSCLYQCSTLVKNKIDDKIYLYNRKIFDRLKKLAAVTMKVFNISWDKPSIQCLRALSESLRQIRFNFYYACMNILITYIKILKLHMSLHIRVGGNRQSKALVKKKNFSWF